MSELAPALLRRAVAAFRVIPDEARGPSLAALDEFLAAPAPATFLAATRILRAQSRRAVVETTAGATMRRAFDDGVAALRNTAVPPTLIDQIAQAPLDARAGPRLLELASLARTYEELAARVAAESDEMRRRLRASLPRKPANRR
jgi:hypothetical protein